MQRLRRAVPNLEILEGRWVPATIRLTSGQLFITDNNASNDILITAVSANKVSVKINGIGAGTYTGVGSLVSVTGNNGDDTVTFDLTAGKLSGNVLVDTGNGADTLAIDGTSIGGNLTVLQGLGDDVTAIGGTAATSVGGTVSINGAAGFDVAILGDGSKVGSNLVLAQTNSVTLLGAASVGGSVNISTAPEAFGNLVLLDTLSLIGGQLNYSSGGGADTLLLNGTVNGNISLNTGDGGDGLITTGLVANGSLTFNSGTGNDSVGFDAATTVSGNVGLIVGEGDNDLTGLASAFTVAGNLTITAGNGLDNIDFGAAVAGNVSITLGNGDNSIEQISGSTIGGNLTIRTGNGANDVFLNGTVGGRLDVLFGTGDDTLTLDIAFSYGSALLNFGAGTDDFVVNMPGGLPAPITIIDLP